VSVKPTKQKSSAIARASQSAGRSDYRVWPGSIAAFLAEKPLINTRLQPGVLPAERRRAVLTASRAHQKPLKRFPSSTRHDTGLKPGVNETQICQTVSDKFFSTEISQTLSAEFEICGTASHKSANAQKLQTMSAKSPVPISATPSQKSTGQKYATASRISSASLALHLKAPCPAVGNSNGESQRDSGLKPKVARHELPWVSAARVNNPNGVAARRRNRGATPLGLKTFTATTQGSSCLATLGWMTQSRWDCRSQMIFRSASDPLLEFNQQAARTRK
jgi:hypothetical protein